MNPEDEFDIRQYVSMLRRRAWVIAAAVVACVIAAAAVSFTQPKLYTAQAKVLISAQQDIAGGGNALSDPNQFQNQIQTQIQIVESPPVAEEAKKALGNDATRVADVSSSGVTNTRVMTVSAVSKFPVIAQKAADAYAAAYLKVGEQTAVDRVASIGQTVSQKQQQLRDQIADVEKQINGSPAPDGPTRATLNNQRDGLNAQIDQLQRQYDTVQAAALVREAGASSFSNAELPTSPTSPKPLRNVAVALVLGALLGVGVVLLIERLDDRVRSGEQLSQWFPGLPQLGIIPNVEGWTNVDEARNVTLADPLSRTAEAYRGLRTSIEFLGLDRELKVIEVTSSTEGEGKTTTVTNLATALAWAGKNVIVVGADLRKPRVHKFFSVSNDSGLTSTILGTQPLDLVLQKAPVSSSDGSVRVLATGPLPPNPSELLASSAVADIFNELRERADYILIDSPPVLPVADSLVLSKYSDGIILVAGVGELRKRELGRALEVITQSTKTPILGVLINGSDDALSYSYKYGYYAAASSTSHAG